MGDLNKDIFVEWANRQGIRKAEGGIADLSTVNFGGILPRSLVWRLISLTRNQNAWLGATSTIMRDRQAGTIPVVDWNEPVTEHVGRNDGTKVTTEPPTWNVVYSCKKFKTEWYVTYEELREAVAAGIDNFEQQMLSDWGTALGNDIARIVMQGDKTLDATTRLNRLLRACDGVDIATEAGSNIFDAQGKAFGQGIFAAMLDKMPDRYAEDGGLMWLFNRRVNTLWHDSLTNVNTTERMRSNLGDQALTSQAVVPPLGISQLIVPQISRAKGPAPIAPTAVVDDGDGSATITLTSLVGATKQIDTVANGVGRKILVTYLPTGLTETLTAYDDGGTLKVATNGSLGQTTISTTASEYTVRVADETDLYLMNPKSIYQVYCSEFRSTRTYNKDFDRFEITTYFEMDIVVPIQVSIVKFKRVTAPPIETWT